MDIVVEDALTPGASGEVAALLERAERADHAPALNEAGQLSLRRTRPGVRHLRAVRDGATVGYAQLEVLPAASTGQVVVDPAARRTGIGSALVEELHRQAERPLHVWAIGNTAAAAGLARATGAVPVRTLLIMTRSLADLPPADVPAGIRIDAFRPGLDEEAWLAVNRRAFAHHPEQGAITAADLGDRMREPWFDPAGFFLARADDTDATDDTDNAGGPVLGFHWTKQHERDRGEVYVLGVDPDAQGRGLAKALLLHGLAYLRERGNTSVELYVEADSATAVGLYTARGFRVASRDVMYGERDQRDDDEVDRASS